MSARVTGRKHAPTVTFLRAYKFADDKKDPIIDAVRAVLDKEDMTIQDCNKQGGPSVTTLYNWFEGKTRCPQYKTVAAAIHSAGYEMAMTKTTRHVNGKAWNAEMPRLASGVARYATL